MHRCAATPLVPHANQRPQRRRRHCQTAAITAVITTITINGSPLQVDDARRLHEVTRATALADGHRAAVGGPHGVGVAVGRARVDAVVVAAVLVQLLLGARGSGGVAAARVAEAEWCKPLAAARAG
jgi:hypothetical protein